MKSYHHILSRSRQHQERFLPTFSQDFAGRSVKATFLGHRCFSFCGALALVLVIILTGCMSKRPNMDQTLAYTIENYPESVAIMPFINNTRIEGVESFVRSTLYSHMSVLPYQDVELSLVDDKLQACSLLGHERVEDIPLDELGYLLGVDAVVFGEVTEFQKVFMGIYSQMAVEVKISVWDTRTGKEIWKDECVSRNHDGGLPLGLLDLPFIIARSGYHLRESSKVRAVDDVARQLASRIPVPVDLKIGEEVSDYADMGDNKPQAYKIKSLKRLTTAYPDDSQVPKKQSLKRLTKRYSDENEGMRISEKQ